MWRFALTFSLLIASIFFVGLGHTVQAQNENKRLITVYDRGTTRVFLSDQKTIGEALKLEEIELDARDTVEPAAVSYTHLRAHET